MTLYNSDAMDLQTYDAFLEELHFIEKDAGLELKKLREGWRRLGAKSYIISEKTIEKLKKAPVLGKPLKGIDTMKVVETLSKLAPGQ